MVGSGLENVTCQQLCRHVARAFGTDKETTDLVVATYARTLTDNFCCLRKALQAGDYPELKFQAHTIKGAFLNLGLENFARKAADMEERAGLQDNAGFVEMVAAMQEGLQPFLAEMAAAAGVS